MNDYQNNHDDQDNMNDNYNSGYGQNNGEEYSYNYTPNNTNRAPVKKKVGKYVLMAVASVLLLMIITVFAIGIATKIAKNLFDDFGGASNKSTEMDDGSNNTQMANPGGANIDVPKNEGHENSGITSAGQAYNTITEVYNAVSDSVVEISTEIVQNSMWMGQYVTTGAGSGVVVHKDGYIVTNHHVIDGASNITVTLKDGTSFGASFVGTDEANDIAVIKIDTEGKELQVAKLGCSNDLVVGEDVIAIGNPLGSLGGTVTEGIISATERHISIDGEDMVLLQTSAAINPGNSGGGLFNMAGELIGVVNAKASGEDIEGLGFAIPIDTAHPVIEDLINYGYVRGVVDHGISVLEVTSQNLFYYSQYYGISTTGVIVVGSKYSTDLAVGDKIETVNGQKISRPADIDKALSDCTVGDNVSVVVSRNGKKITVALTLREQVPEYVDFG